MKRLSLLACSQSHVNAWTLILLIAALSFINFVDLKAQTSVFSTGDNGTFEAPGSEASVVNYYLPTWNNVPRFNDPAKVTINRVQNIKHGGNSALRVEVNRESDNRGYFFMPIDNTNSQNLENGYVLSAWIYLPSATNPGSIQVNIGSRATNIVASSPAAECTLPNTQARPKDTWFQVKQWVPHWSYGNQFSFDFYLIIKSSNTANMTSQFYIDDVVVYRGEQFFNLNAVVNDNDVVLNPSGPFPNLPDFPQSTYTYEWEDGVTTKDRIDVRYGRVGITGTGTVNYNCAGGFGFAWTVDVPPRPPCVTSVVNLCASPTATHQLVAGCSFDNGITQWYDRQRYSSVNEGIKIGYFDINNPFAGNTAVTTGILLGTGSTLTIGPFPVPGVYKYYVQHVLIQTLYGNLMFATVRKEVTVNVGPVANFEVSDPPYYKNKPFTISILNDMPGLGNYTFAFDDGGSATSTGAPVSHAFATAGNHSWSATANLNGCNTTYSSTLPIQEYQALCTSTIPRGAAPGTVKLDTHSGQIIYDVNGNCKTIDMGCIEGKVAAPLMANVVSSTANIYSDRWNMSYLSTPPIKPGGYENGSIGKWRSKAAFEYTSAVNYQQNDRNYVAGRYTLPMFNWAYPYQNNRNGWIKKVDIEKYSINGEAVEQRNALNVSSVTKFGYGGAVPYLVAQHATYGNVMFESFEFKNGTLFEDNTSSAGGFENSEVAHSGKYSFQLTGQFTTRPIISDGRKSQVRFWATGLTSAANVNISVAGGTSTPLKELSRVGRWSLLEAIVTSATTFTVMLSNVSSNTISIDDLRVQPTDAEMICYVYDVKTLKLIASFDNQHFGLYYQYNDEGKLVRKQVETERGIKTLEETQYNSPQMPKIE